jgi:formamidopyrimidine-DNA glycosylase
MPELPEVETMVRGIRGAVEGTRILSVMACRSPCRPLEITPSVKTIARQVAGQTIRAVRRRAKRVILELESGAGFVIEPRMTGLMLLADPPTTKHLRFEWRLSSGTEERTLWFWDQRGLGTIRLLSADELSALLEVGRLGKDALDMTALDWVEVCRASSRPIKVLLLDQKRVAGIGNLYASEILHLSGIDPQTHADQLSRKKLQKMSDAVLSVLEMAIRYEGSTLSDGTYRNALNKNGGYQNAHRVYDREDELCPTCERSNVLRIVQAQRSTFYCPRCQ